MNKESIVVLALRCSLFYLSGPWRGVADLHTVPVPNDKAAALDCNISTDSIADVIAGY